MKDDKLDVRIPYLMDLANRWYPKKKFTHALQVACFASDSALKHVSVDNTEAFLVGLAHDLIEDTECPQNELEDILGPRLFTAVLDLTKTDEESYEEYILRILSTKDDLVLLVKRADMKDHMKRLDTLTDKLKKKYLPILHYFL